MDFVAPPDFVTQDVDLGRHNTLALPGRAAFYARITTPEQLATLTDPHAFCDRRFVLGGGSNLVLGGDFDGLEAGQFFCQCRESGGKTQDKRGKTGNSHENSTGIGFSLAGMRLAGGDYLVRMSLLLLVRRRR